MSIAIVVPHTSPRLTYVLDWVFEEQLQLPYTLLTDQAQASSFDCVIAYGVAMPNTCSVPNTGLLFAADTKPQEVLVGTWQELPTLFACPNQDTDLPFDIFSAIFYLISRYEEYLPFQSDKHNRFPAQSSILYQHDLLERPIVDEWLSAFAQHLEQFSIVSSPRQFEFIPTYDIDIAWQYVHKGLVKTLAGFVKSILHKDWTALRIRIQTLWGNRKDPYDSFAAQDALHQQAGLEPLYFILLAVKNTAFDKNILPTHPAMKALIEKLASQYKIGIHPSYYTDVVPEKMHQEHQKLQSLIQKPIAISRQHYIKMALPQTYTALLAMGIKTDYSMGYGTHLGFRAGTSRSFYWYQLDTEQTTALRVVPFCFMDTTAHYELKLSAEEALSRLNAMVHKTKMCEGLVVTIFHNFSLGTATEWEGWPAMYAQFVQQHSQK
jgi:hypothetical protein